MNESVHHCLQQAQSRGLNRLDAQLLLLYCLGKPASDRAWLMAHDDVLPAPGATQKFQSLIQRRADGEPLAYLTGRKEFFGLDLQVDARVLVPRPDTETLVDWAIEIATQNQHSLAQGALTPWRIVDLGTGSGAIALALKHALPAAQVWATDFSEAALEVATANARSLNLSIQFAQGAWLQALAPESRAEGYDLIVSNPPYIAEGDTHLPALVHEPRCALVSGADGLDDIRHIVAQAPACLKPGGWLLLEHGHDQATAVAQLLQNQGFASVQNKKDLAGVARVTGGQIPQT